MRFLLEIGLNSTIWEFPWTVWWWSLDTKYESGRSIFQDLSTNATAMSKFYARARPLVGQVTKDNAGDHLRQPSRLHRHLHSTGGGMIFKLREGGGKEKWHLNIERRGTWGQRKGEHSPSLSKKNGCTISCIVALSWIPIQSVQTCSAQCYEVELYR